MIKQLIIDIAFDKINTNQALNRARIIAKKLKNTTFNNWLLKELIGYKENDQFLPDYRILNSGINLTVEFPNHKTQTFPVILPKNSSQSLMDIIYCLNFTEPIPVIEQTIEEIKNGKAYFKINPEIAGIIGDLYKKIINESNGILKSEQRDLSKSQLLKIVELTRQKLLDTLQNLDDQFPEFENRYEINKENNQKTQNIVTTNIYGNNNPLNIVTGQGSSTNEINLTLISEIKERLEELGLEKEEIKQFEILDKVNPKGAENRNLKIMSWFDEVSAGLAVRGIYEKIPAFTEYISSIV